MVWGRELYVDATRVRVDADTDSLVPRFYHETIAHLTGVFTTDAGQAGEQENAATGVHSVRPGRCMSW